MSDIPDNPQSQAVIVASEVGSISKAMTVEELHENLEFIRQVMRTEMRDGQDYGKIPGTGEKPCLLQPGAQKLLMTFNLTEQVKKETVRDFPGFHREYEFVVTVQSQNGKQWDGVGTCSTLESKYRYRKAELKCPQCGQNHIIAGKAEYGGGFVCFKKKGGCGAKFADNDERIASQPAGTVEYENPPDYWNTARKMAFKRALVAAAINATNTSELWTQDVEEMAENEKSAPKSPQTHQTTITTPPTHQKRAVEPINASLEHPGEQECADFDSSTPSKPAKYAYHGKVTESHKNRFLANLEPLGKVALEYMQKAGYLLPTEGLEDLPLDHCPATKDQFDAAMAKISAFVDGGPAEKWDLNEPEFKINHRQNPSVKGVISSVSLKEGKSAKGPWSHWGIKIEDQWFNTFSNSIGKLAQANKGNEVTLFYSKTDRGNEALEILLADGTTSNQ